MSLSFSQKSISWFQYSKQSLNESKHIQMQTQNIMDKTPTFFLFVEFWKEFVHKEKFM